MKISAVIITDNNPKVLNAIKSVYDFCFEIVVINNVESFSVAKQINQFDKKGKVVYGQYVWRDDFADARNYAIEKATGDYIFSIDSDEVLENKSLNISNEYDFYFVNIYNGNRPHKVIRIFKNIPEIRYKNKLHESVEDSVKDLKGTKTNILIRHNGLESIEDLRSKAERNYRILLKDVDNPHRDIHLCKHYFAVGDYESAIEYGNKALKIEDVNEDNKAILCNILYECCEKQGFTGAGVAFLKKSIEIFPQQITARYLICNYLYSLKDRLKHKNLLLAQLKVIGSLITFKNSELSNEIYLSINVVNKKIKEIQQWQ